MNKYRMNFLKHIAENGVNPDAVENATKPAPMPAVGTKEYDKLRASGKLRFIPKKETIGDEVHLICSDNVVRHVDPKTGQITRPDRLGKRMSKKARRKFRKEQEDES